MKSLSHQLIPSITAAVAVLVLAGCSTPSASTPVSTPAASTVAAAPAPAKVGAELLPTPPPPEGIPLVAGMKAPEVEALLGKPAEVRAMDVNGVKADVWVYMREGTPTRREVTTGMREIQWVDPVSGRELTRQEPIIGYVTETPQLELRLLMFKGSLVNWTQIMRGSDSTFT